MRTLQYVFLAATVITAGTPDVAAAFDGRGYGAVHLEWRGAGRHAPARASGAGVTAPARQIASRGRQSDDSEAPRIHLPPKLVTGSDYIDIVGAVSDDSAVFALFVNERRLALRADGGFRFHGRLEIGVNSFVFVAIDEWGNRATKRVEIVRK